MASYKFLFANQIDNSDLLYHKKSDVTFFSMMYQKHDDFFVMQHKHLFTQQIQNDKKMSCIIDVNSNYIAKPYLVVKLPSIRPQAGFDGIAWVRYIGYALINNVQFQVNNKVLEQLSGEWMYINHMLNMKEHDLDKIIGNIDKLTQYTSGKDEYQLEIPLPFSFQEYQNAFDLSQQQNKKVRIVVTFNDLQKCVNMMPGHYMNVSRRLKFIQENQYFYNEKRTVIGIFHGFDKQTKQVLFSYVQYIGDGFKEGDDLYCYIDQQFIKIGQSGTLKTNQIIINDIQDQLRAYIQLDHVYIDKSLDDLATQTIQKEVQQAEVSNENRFFKQKMEDLQRDQMKIIHQVQQVSLSAVINHNNAYSIHAVDDVKYLVWFIDQQYDPNHKRVHKIPFCFERLDVSQDAVKTPIESQNITFNDIELVSHRSGHYFSDAIQYNRDIRQTDHGIMLNLFCVNPLNTLQPSGSINANVIKNIQMDIKLQPQMALRNMKFKCYQVKYNFFDTKKNLLLVDYH